MKLTQWSLMAFGLLAPGLALAGTQSDALTMMANQDTHVDCSQDADLFVSINADLGQDTVITALKGYNKMLDGEPSLRLREKPFSTESDMAGNAQGIYTVSVNAECLADGGVMKIGGGLTQLTTNTSNGMMLPIQACEVFVDVIPGHYSKTLVENNGHYSCH